MGKCLSMLSMYMDVGLQGKHSTALDPQLPHLHRLLHLLPRQVRLLVSAWSGCWAHDCDGWIHGLFNRCQLLVLVPCMLQCWYSQYIVIVTACFEWARACRCWACIWMEDCTHSTALDPQLPHLHLLHLLPRQVCLLVSAGPGCLVHNCDDECMTWSIDISCLCSCHFFLQCWYTHHIVVVTAFILWARACRCLACVWMEDCKVNTQLQLICSFPSAIFSTTKPFSV